MHRIRFLPRLQPGPGWGDYSAPPDPLAGVTGVGEKGEGKEEGEGGGEIAFTPPFLFSAYATDYDVVYKCDELLTAACDHVTVVITHIQACIEDGTVPPIVWRCTSPATATLTVM